MAEKLLTVREAAQFLGISEKEVIDLSQEGIIPAYRIAGTHLRFRQDQLQDIRSKIKDSLKESHKKIIFQDNSYSSGERFFDFFYFNDFYIVALVVIITILFLFFR
ncbi:MAG: helix-turn-helix domain-containing protein [Candidatus Omnitrophota bacterium]